MSKNNIKNYVKIGLGVDAGGTYTDAVIFDLEDNLTLCKAKSLTTKWDYSVGISKALEMLDQDYIKKIELVALSTTLVTNAIVENEGQKVGMILMPPYGLDVTKSIPHNPKSVIQGQMEFSGKEIVPIDPDEVKAVMDQMVGKYDVNAFAISGYAAFINPAHELQVKDIIQAETGFYVSCGHELSDSLNYSTRAVTAMLNARTASRFINLLRDLETVLVTHTIDAPFVVVKGDGTLMSAEMAKQRPVETIFSGPAASVAGAKHLTGIEDALVTDMGGTTTDTAALSAGMVKLSESGSIVGGHRTHVKALDIRTTGLGGDSLILYDRGEFHIGPKRVAPIAWMGATWPNADHALDYIKRNIKNITGSTRKMQILVKTGDINSTERSPLEETVIELLEQRPYTVDELVQVTDVLNEFSLPLERLEEEFIIQRCGLTLTDLLHISGQFEKWDTRLAKRYAEFFAMISHTPLPVMIRRVLESGKQKLSIELLKRRLDDDMDADQIDSCPVCQSLINKLLNKQSPDYEVGITFKHPVIGIGAPIQYFLPGAVLPFKTDAIFPEDMDVANAIGAITSRVHIHKELLIFPHKDLGFIVEGVSGATRFKTKNEAELFAITSLRKIVFEQAEKTGTSCKTITIKYKDSKTTIFTGEVVFIKQILSITLNGPPDLVVIQNRQAR